MSKLNFVRHVLNMTTNLRNRKGKKNELYYIMKYLYDSLMP